MRVEGAGQEGDVLERAHTLTLECVLTLKPNI